MKTTKINKKKDSALITADMETTNIPNVIVDLTDESKTVSEAIASCERIRIQAMPWYKKLIKRIKKIV